MRASGFVNWRCCEMSDGGTVSRTCALAEALAASFAAPAVAQQDDVASYYRGRTVQAVVGYTPGYLGMVVAPGPTVVYGTGYTYPGWANTLTL